jgi:hypothetical protein
MAGFLLSSFIVKSGPGPTEVIFNTTPFVTTRMPFTWAVDVGSVFNSSAKTTAISNLAWGTDVGTVFNSIAKPAGVVTDFNWSK